MRKKRKTGFLLLLLLILLGGCGKTDFQIPEQETEQTETTEETKQIQETAKAKVISRGAWCVYWDTGAVQKAAESLSEYDELILFGCIYDENGDLYIPEQLEQLYEAFPEQGERTTRYLSFINDVIQEDGTAIQKSPEFLARVLKEEQLGNRVIEEMIAQTKAWGLDGVELDYENIDKQENLWQEYLEFVDRLSRRIQEEGLLLRVVLGAYAPVRDYSFPTAPQYVVMCYNLYGTHSAPGPKADAAFLQQVVERFDGMNVAFALANGGFEWDAQEKTVRSLTAANAVKLLVESGSDYTREENGAVHFNYPVEDGIHTIWYGDKETIATWEDVLVQYSGHDIKIDLWRLE